MRVKQIDCNKKQYLDLLLLGDEQEDMIDRYLERGEMFVLLDPTVRTVCVVTKEAEGLYEIKNLATAPSSQRRGYGRAMVEYVAARYRGPGRILQVGTGDSPLTVPFYQSCGFVEAYRLKGFFTEHYDHPIVEGGRLLTDMVYFQKRLDG